MADSFNFQSLPIGMPWVTPFTSSGTYTKKDTSTVIEVMTVGGGGGAGSGANGGAGGTFTLITFHMPKVQ